MTEQNRTANTHAPDEKPESPADAVRNVEQRYGRPRSKAAPRSETSEAGLQPGDTKPIVSFARGALSAPIADRRGIDGAEMKKGNAMQSRNQKGGPSLWAMQTWLLLAACALLPACVSKADWPSECDAPSDVGYSYITAAPSEVQLDYASDSQVVTICNTSGFTVTWYARCSEPIIMLPAATGVLVPLECRDVIIQGIGDGLEPGAYPATVEFCNIATEAPEPTPTPDPVVWTGYGPENSTTPDPDQSKWTVTKLTAQTGDPATNRHILRSWTGGNLSGRLRTDHVNGGAGIVWCVVIEGDVLIYHRIRWCQWTELVYSPHGPGETAWLGARPPPNTWVRFRIETAATELRVKTWWEGGTEPDTWTIIANANGETSGLVGLWTMGSGEKVLELDDTEPSPTPTPEPDNCPADPNKTEPGVCGCGVPDDDTDGDGVPDCLDLCPADGTKVAPGRCGCGTPDYTADLDLDCDVDLADYAEFERQLDGSGPQ